ncbi:hypothetical protein QBC45DRAFT_476502 [Copromyces sp. CBS 386.78]|nr:hypothetical protein QBC45DRAFT_476502 [Copromyces sp. CBS 386.78]
MHGKRLRDIFPAIPERIDHWLFSQLLARPATAGKACALEHCSMLTAPLTDRLLTVEVLELSAFELGGRSTRADRSEERTTCGGCSGHRTLMNNHGLYNEARDLNWSHVRRDGPLTWSAFASHCRPSHPTLQTGPRSSTSVCIRGPLVTVRGRLVHGHPLPQGSAEYTVGL